MTIRGVRFFTKSAGAGASAALSVGLHTLLITAAVIATAAPKVVTQSELAEIFARFLAPPDKSGAMASQREQLKFIALTDPASLLPGRTLVHPDEVAPAMADRKVSGLDLQTVAATAAVEGTQDSVFTLIEVDSAATRYAWSAAPVYPQAMLDAKKEGYVKAQWVVDESGYADTTTFTLLDYTANEFAKAVREALPFMRFSPAKMGDKVVKQMVMQEFTFKIANAIANTGGTGATGATGAAKKP
jgi:hypothetical protein